MAFYEYRPPEAVIAYMEMYYIKKVTYGTYKNFSSKASGYKNITTNTFFCIEKM